MGEDWLRPIMVASRVQAVMTTRGGGVSAGPWEGFNLGSHVGDDPEHVEENRAAFAQKIGATPVFLSQMHGSEVVRLDPAMVTSGNVPRADASLSTEPGIACTVLGADCLPVLMAAPEGRAVAAAHAGWRGLAQGVVDATLTALCETAGCEPEEVLTWLGACIGPTFFEVGADVLEGFNADPRHPGARFIPSGASELPRWHADLAGLARDRLTALRVFRIDGGEWCTVKDRSRFFSFRRDGICGRMAAAIWIR